MARPRRRRQPAHTVHGVFQGLFQVAQVHPRGGAAAARAACGGGVRLATAACGVRARSCVRTKPGFDQLPLWCWPRESYSSIANLPNLLLKDKAQVGFEAKNCKRVLIICEIVAFLPYLQPPIFSPPQLFIILFIPNAKTTENHQNVWKGTSSFLFLFYYIGGLLCLVKYLMTYFRLKVFSCFENILCT